MVHLVRYNPHNRHGPPKTSTKLTLQEEEEILRSLGVTVPQRHRWAEITAPSQQSQYTIENGHISRLRLRIDGECNDIIAPLLSELGKLTSLTELDLAHNELGELPPGIGCLTRLQVLNISEAKLTTVSPEIGDLISLTHLDLSFNLLTDLPETLSQLSELKVLILRNNLLTNLPENLSCLSRLRTLDVRNNHLTAIPASFKDRYSLIL